MTRVLSSAPSTASKLAQLGRPQNVVYPGLLAIETAYLRHQWLSGLYYYALLLCLYSLAAGYNNVRDVAIDRRNGAKRNPLVTGGLTSSVIYWWFAINILLVGTLQFLLVQPSTVLLSTLYILLLYAYSSRTLHVQSRGFLATALLAVCYGALPILFAGLPYARSAWWLASVQATLLFPYLLAKDYKDLHGDRLGGKLTPLVRHGARTVRQTAIIVFGIGSLGVLYLATVIGRGIVITGCSLLLAATGSCMVILHKRKGVVSPYFIRLVQGLLLLLNGLLTATFV